MTHLKLTLATHALIKVIFLKGGGSDLTARLHGLQNRVPKWAQGGMCTGKAATIFVAPLAAAGMGVDAGVR